MTCWCAGLPPHHSVVARRPARMKMYLPLSARRCPGAGAVFECTTKNATACLITNSCCASPSKSTGVRGLRCVLPRFQHHSPRLSGGRHAKECVHPHRARLSKTRGVLERRSQHRRAEQTPCAVAAKIYICIIPRRRMQPSRVIQNHPFCDAVISTHRRHLPPQGCSSSATPRRR